jgi:hypothetical protein
MGNEQAGRKRELVAQQPLAEPQFDIQAALKEICAELEAIRAELHVLAQGMQTMQAQTQEEARSTQRQSGVYEVELIEDTGETDLATRQVPAQRQPGVALFSVGVAPEPTAIVLEQKSRRRAVNS